MNYSEGEDIMIKEDSWSLLNTTEMPPKSKRKVTTESASSAPSAAGEEEDSMISLPPGVSITWQLEDRAKDTWVVYSPEVQDALTAAAMVGKKQVNLMAG